jgi:dolichol-phosphate mannosyltransferase
MSRRVADVFRTRLGEHNPFLRGLVGWVGFKIAYVPFTPVARARGKSKYNASSLINFAVNGICSFSKVPLRFCIGAGCIMATLSILSAIIQIAIYFLGSFEVPGWASIFAAVSFIGGIQLFFLGVVGEYIGLIFDEVKNRPRYIVEHHYHRDRTFVRDGRPELAQRTEDQKRQARGAAIEPSHNAG